MDKRNNTIDIMKGFAIILMVAGHTYNHFYHNFIYLFHVAVFYIISGICFNDIYTENLKNLFILFKKRILSLWIPYFSYNFVFLILHKPLIKIGFLTTDIHYFDYMPYLNDGYTKQFLFGDYVKAIFKSIFFINSQPFVGGLWFLGGLFYVTLVYSIIHIILKKMRLEKFHIIVSLTLLIIAYFIKEKGYINTIPLLKQVCLIFITEVLFDLGTTLRQFKNKSFSKQNSLFISIICFSILVIASKKQTISIASISIINPLYYLLYSMIGLIFLYTVGILITNSFLEKIFIFFGKNTIPVLALHTFFFKIINIIQMITYKEERIVLSLYPVWKNNILWSLLYILVGIIFPVLIILLFRKNKISQILFKI